MISIISLQEVRHLTQGAGTDIGCGFFWFFAGNKDLALPLRQKRLATSFNSG
jgi:hypothetical protein